MDLLELAERDERQARRNGPVPCLFATPARGFAARTAELAAHEAAYGPRSGHQAHGWRSNHCHPEAPASECQPTVLQADLGCGGHEGTERGARCQCAGGLVHRGACLGCDWEGQVRGEENAATEDACDHSWPGWRDRPVVDGPPCEDRRRAAWSRRVAALYPPGWVESGGPVRTRRTPGGTRHAWKHGLGYDMCGEVTPRPGPPASPAPGRAG
jgi:hypothetical protein